jgi:chaperonin cofactor prefoldin
VLNDATVKSKGVAPAAIQGLNQKLEKRDLKLQKRKPQNEMLEKRLDNPEPMIKSMIEKN